MKLLHQEHKMGVIVLGGHVQALGILRMLGRLDVEGGVIDKTNKCIARHSKYCKHFFKVEDDKLLEFLIDKGSKGDFQGWTVFPTNDFHVKILSQNKEKLTQFYRLAVDCWNNVEIFYNKRNTYELAERLGLPIPKTFYPLNADALKTLKVPFPCIIKPAVMHSFYIQTKKKVFVCRTEEELLLNYNLALNIIPSNEILVQEIISGDSGNQFSVGLLFLNCKVISHVIVCRKRQHPLDFGNATTYAETARVPILKEYAERIVSSANYSGICEVEFKFDSNTNEYKLLEVNPRTWKWHSISNKSKSPFVPLFFNHLNGLEVNKIEGFKDASFQHFLTDFVVQLQLLLKGNFKLLKTKRPIESAIWAHDDLRPWFYEKFYLFYLIKSR